MSKRLKLNNLFSPKVLRSNRNIVSSNLSLDKSQYFDEPDAPMKVKKELCEEIITNTTKLENKHIIKDLEKEAKEKEARKNTSKLKVNAKQRAKIKIEYESSDVIKSDTKNIKEEIKVKNKSVASKKAESETEWEPANFQVIVNNIRDMRKHESAPVDTMGCHKCADVEANPAVYRYQSLLALMLSSQTKDQVTHAVMKRLKIHGCEPQIIAGTPHDELQKLIYPRKAEYIKKATNILLTNYGGDIPKTVGELCKLPGVGPKMGHICMDVAWGEVSGIGVDTHVHRISNRLKWVRKPTKTPEETRTELESWMPKHLWSEINHLLVGFGQEICLPRFPKCKECLNESICPFKNQTK
ncbi:endonuclease III-like protein 1 isoform X2 [Prorops nasuta]|uniref:endonuclease III-like protein 1 isoform X2 n=1 Tax=Prorops nasuta TaxID=863751 RepID=UPI0034CD6D10